MLKKNLQKIKSLIYIPLSLASRLFQNRYNSKELAEITFWKKELTKYIKWYQGKEKLYNCPFLKPDKKILGYDLATNATTTWLEVFQKRKYLTDLQLKSDAFRGLKVLDVGCGPFPNLLAFINCERHGIDPLIRVYQKIGYPIQEWSRWGFVYHCAVAENMPFPDNYFDAVVSVNAIDHVNDFTSTAKEVRRVLKQNGLFQMHVHYHKKTLTEPLELNNDIFLKHYGWVKGLKKVHESNKKDCGLYAAPEGELFVLWRNH